MSLPTEPATQPHRNHGLFSDHYLDVTLPDRPGWRSMVEQAQPVMEEISRLFASFTPSTNEAQTERDLVRPILKLLGHAYEVQPALETPDGTKRPDYVLYRDADAFVEEVRKRRPRSAGRLTPAALKDLRAGYAEIAMPVREGRAEAADLERQLSDLVNRAYGLTPEEVDLLWSTAPPRMPRF